MSEATLKVTFCGPHTAEQKAQVLDRIRASLAEDELDVGVEVQPDEPAEEPKGVFIAVQGGMSCDDATS